jgi:hypothetical protein
MRGAAERASGLELGWFFDQWVHRTGLVDYALRDVDVERGDGGWVTRARVVKRGAYAHPMPVGVRTDEEWTFARIAPASSDTTIEIRTAARPDEVRLDPRHLTEDWDARNDVAPPGWLDALLFRDARFGSRPKRTVIDWPFLDQFDRYATVNAVLPFAWYGDESGVNYALRVRSNYLGFVDRVESGIAYATEGPDRSRWQYWVVAENARDGAGVDIGERFGLWWLDDVVKVELRKTVDRSRYFYAGGTRRSTTWAATATVPAARFLLPEAFTGPDYTNPTGDPALSAIVNVFDVSVASEVRGTRPQDFAVRGLLLAGAMTGPEAPRNKAFARAELEGTRETYDAGGRFASLQRLFLGVEVNSPLRRAIGVSSRDATDTFDNHFWRPYGALLKQDAVDFTPLGGMGLRGYAPGLFLGEAAGVAGNLEWGMRLARFGRSARSAALWATLFGDGALVFAIFDDENFGEPDALADAGVGIALRGMLFDRAVIARVDVPLYVEHPELAAGADGLDDRIEPRLVLSIGGF